MRRSINVERQESLAPVILCKMLAVLGTVVALTGCGVLNNLNSMRASMDQMAYYTSIMAANMPYMAQSAGRMADTTDRMVKTSNDVIVDIQKRGGAMERTIENISQASLGMSNKTVQHLDGIRSELKDLNKAVGSAAGKTSGPGQQPPLDALQARITALEARLGDISSRLEKYPKSP